MITRDELRLMAAGQFVNMNRGMQMGGPEHMDRFVEGAMFAFDTIEKKKKGIQWEQLAQVALQRSGVQSHGPESQDVKTSR